MGGIALVPSGSSEGFYQRAFREKLTGSNMPLGPTRISHDDGYGAADFFLPDTIPPMLIEIKRDGDWRRVAEAAAQLWGYGQPPYDATYKLAVFGERVQHEHLAGILRKLDVDFIRRSSSSDA